jgi:hypothetical protein
VAGKSDIIVDAREVDAEVCVLLADEQRAAKVLHTSDDVGD